ncbi:biotin-dependent carboxyltransferase family protein [Alkalimonas collagenimarina]|uniref:Biotin-dependent carboxyltransferase family protein n=1 Tax=Alkalimonas collagenimarina TaxID=400390 RepID=A0ABT9GXI3_9GAMM|nr:biotin-dependent carboxyltransferase family protein [Alkalimonas collagenimarina]MDP4535752.1 biotin-dependent carboxyltransferase family protein [Alkalimonas collagenimarina]
MTGIRIEQPGILSLLQDQGRFGQSQLGLTTGGPADAEAFRWANALLGNTPGSCCIEISMGGLELTMLQPSRIAVCGAEMPLRINQQPKPLWQSHPVQAGDIIELAMATAGLRSYLAVDGGFQLTPQFGSLSTVVREGIGGLDGGKLKVGQQLAIGTHQNKPNWQLPKSYRPDYQAPLKLRLIEGYQSDDFSIASKQRFYQHTFRISQQSDRMGYRLEGLALSSQRRSMLSEGICYGAVQVPPDGQPIVLLSDRQTLGGYPKLGSVLSLDCWQLAQRSAGTELHFEAISIEQAHNTLHLAEQQFQRRLQHLQPVV